MMNSLTGNEERYLPRFIDERFAQWLVLHFGKQLNEQDKTAIANLAAAVSHAVFLKHTCLDLDKIESLAEPALSALMKNINAAKVQELFANIVPPLVASENGKQVWLQKYHYFEQQCAVRLTSMATAGHLSAVSDDLLNASQLSNEQKKAAKMALEHGLAVITGGPGTGKTYTVARIIAMLLDMNPSCQIRLAAPTGKAGQRMKEALTAALPGCELSASTLESLLGINYHSPKPAFNRFKKLQLDVLIIDEASMIDLQKMYYLLDALPDHARLILLGDKDQLVSVQAGGVLAELCECAALKKCIFNITESRRFSGDSEIFALASWLNGNTAQKPVLEGNKVNIHISANNKSSYKAWLEMARAQYQLLQATIVDGASVRDILGAQQNFQLLCALRKGPFGVEGINAMLESSLGYKPQSWYAGKPLIIMKNDKERKLFNGDVGMVLPLSADKQTIDFAAGNLKACFLAGDNGIKTIAFNQMPEYEPCYALTVHKSQGSEYRHVLIVLPNDAREFVLDNPVLSKELAYTAVTRAKDKIDIFAGEGVLELMAGRTTVRMSGLAQMLENTI